MPAPARFCRLIAVLALLLLLLLAARPAVAQGDIALPAPYISRALDAVLMPINGAVAGAFGLRPDERGVLVLAVQPGGVANSYGIVPGDVLYQLAGKRIRDPRHLDVLVLRDLRRGGQAFPFDLYRGGAVYVVETLITVEYYEEVFYFEEISTWES